mmetsp:Transcript_31034/g.68864  ORF Transcript_31034/g.68864 Transcript_31034/m.68864 type:complete len:237 (-) Transcript_31034:1142-1852(-)
MSGGTIPLGPLKPAVPAASSAAGAQDPPGHSTLPCYPCQPGGILLHGETCSGAYMPVHHGGGARIPDAPLTRGGSIQGVNKKCCTWVKPYLRCTTCRSLPRPAKSTYPAALQWHPYPPLCCPSYSMPPPAPKAQISTERGALAARGVGQEQAATLPGPQKATTSLWLLLHGSCKAPSTPSHQRQPSPYTRQLVQQAGRLLPALPLRASLPAPHAQSWACQTPRSHPCHHPTEPQAM